MKKYFLLIAILLLLFKPLYAQTIKIRRIVHDNLSNIDYEIQNIKYQTWIVDNLRSKIYIGNKTIPVISDTNLLSNINYGATLFNDGGFLYNWFVVETQNVCPWGWKVPSLMDFNKLIDHLDNDSSRQAKF